MSSFVASPPLHARWVRKNRYARALADEANARHELKRFLEGVELLSDVLDSLSRLDSTVRLDRQDVDDLVRHGKNFVEFYEQVFDTSWDRGDPFDDGAVLGLTPGFLRLASTRLLRDLPLENLATSSRSDAVLLLVDRYLDVWKTAGKLDGLATLPRCLREITEHAEQNADLAWELPELNDAYKALGVAWTERIRKELYGEHLLMASYQSPDLGECAAELIDRDALPAIADLRAFLDGKLPAEPSTAMTAGEACQRLDSLIRKVDKITDLGCQWVDWCEWYVELIEPDNDTNDLTEVLVLGDDQASGKEDLLDDVPTAVFVNAHADDETTKPGGLVSELVAAGWRCILIPTSDNSASAHQEPFTDRPKSRRNFPDVRRDEGVKAAAALGFSEVVFLNEGDGGMRADPSSHRRRLVEQTPEVAAERLANVIGRYQPRLVIAVNSEAPYDHPDHVFSEHIARLATERLRAKPAGPHLPVYYVTSLAPDALQHRYDALGLTSLIGPMRDDGAVKPTTCLKLGLGSHRYPQIRTNS